MDFLLDDRFSTSLYLGFMLFLFAVPVFPRWQSLCICCLTCCFDKISEKSNSRKEGFVSDQDLRLPPTMEERQSSKSVRQLLTLCS